MPITPIITEKKMSIKQRLGKYIIPNLPFSRHVFNHFRTETNAIYVRLLHKFHPRYRSKIASMRGMREVLLNVGCGPFGREGFVNLDLYWAHNITLRSDCRRSFPLADSSCRAIHVEHFFEHLSHDDERYWFLEECIRVLEPTGLLRVIVPDAELFVRAYVGRGWQNFQEIAAEGDRPELNFKTKMEAVNHVFLQGYEHYGGYDFETLKHVLTGSGFVDVVRKSWKQGDFPGGPIDREQHRPYSLYVEAKKDAS